MNTDWPQLTEACLAGMRAAADQPGRFGGRYVARRINGDQNEFHVLGDDDPNKYAADSEWDVIAQATPTEVHGIGRARCYLHRDCTVHF